MLLAPAVWGWSTQPLAYKLALALAAHIAPAKVFKPPSFVTDHISASDNTAELIAMGRDPLMIWGARSDTLYGLVTTMEHGWREIGELKAPTLYLMGEHDQIIPREPALRRPDGCRAGDRTAYYAEGWHLLMRDKQAPNVWADVAAFLRDPAAPLPSGAPPIPGTAVAGGPACGRRSVRSGRARASRVRRPPVTMTIFSSPAFEDHEACTPSMTDLPA